jgi:hypothetical protein
MSNDFILKTLGFQPSNAGTKNEIPELRSIDAQLDADRARQNQKGLLERGLNDVLQTVWHADRDSEKRLTELRQEIVEAQIHNDVAAIGKLDADVSKAIQSDQEASAASGLRDGLSSFVVNTAISSTYFIRGARGRTAATLLTGANDIHPEDGAAGMIGDGLLGAARGYALARTYEALGKTKFSPVGKGVAIGLTSRFEDGLLNAQSYKDETAQFSLSTGLGNTASSISNPFALLSDVATFGIANGASKAFEFQFGKEISKNPVLANAVTGFTLGIVSGANGEIQKESKTGNFDALNLFEQSILSGASSASAAVLGAKAEQTNLFAPGKMVTETGVRPEGSIMLPSPRGVEPTSVVEPSVDTGPLKFVEQAMGTAPLKVLEPRAVVQATNIVEPQPAPTRKFAPGDPPPRGPLPVRHPEDEIKFVNPASDERIPMDWENPTFWVSRILRRWDHLPDGDKVEALGRMKASSMSEGSVNELIQTAIKANESPLVNLVAISKFNTLEPGYQQLNFDFVASRENPNLSKMLFETLPELDPGAIENILKWDIGNSKFKAAYHASGTVAGLPENLAAKLAKPMSGDMLATYTDIAAGLPEVNRHRLWKSVLGLTDTEDYLGRLSQQEREREWSRIKNLPPLALISDRRFEQLGRYWLDKLQRGDSVTTAAFGEFSPFPERPPNLIRSDAGPSRFEPFGSSTPVDEINSVSWSPLELDTLPTRLPRKALTDEMTPYAIGVELADESTKPAETIGKVKTLFPQLEFRGAESALKSLQKNPNFLNLDDSDRTDVGWAVLCHYASVGDAALPSGSRASIAYAVLSTIKYDPIRSQRIANLVDGLEIAAAGVDNPTGRYGSHALSDLAVMFRVPNERNKWGIALEAAGIENAQALSRVVNIFAPARARNLLPLLTTKLPNNFGAYKAKGRFVFHAHSSTHDDVGEGAFGIGIGQHFIDALPQIESPQGMISAVYLTDQNRTLYRYERKPSVVAILSAPPEHVSQAGAYDLRTGTKWDSTWDRHIQDAYEWSQIESASQHLLPSIWDGQRLTGEEMMGAWNALSGYHSLQDIENRGTPADVGAQKRVIDSMTEHITGYRPHNEVKLVNGTWSGILVQRQGMPVSFEGMSDNDRHRLFGAMTPDWVVGEPKGWETDTIRIAESVWREAQRRGIPIIFADE